MTRTQNRTANAVSLFPFLAVLVCAMGALIFLLIIITRRVRSDVVAHAREVQSVPRDFEEDSEPEELPEIVTLFPLKPERAAQQLPELKPPVQKKPLLKNQPEPFDPDAALRIEIVSLAGDRNRRQKTLADMQVALSNARKRLNETESESARMERQSIETEEQRRENNKQTNLAVTKRRRLTEQLEYTRQQIKQVRRQHAEAVSRYAFIPFDGVSGTTRRPILVECSGSGLRFVPEGISLTLDDLEGFTLEVNPLLAGSQSLAEYFFKKDSRAQTEGETSNPYVLLLVRPSGSVSYYAARKLLSNLGRPFGYELIEEDWELDLSEVDPEARRICRAAVERAETKRKTTVRAFVIGRGTGTGGRMIRFHKETGSFEVVGSGSSSLSGTGPLSKNRYPGNVTRSATQTSQQQPSMPRRKVIDVAGVPADRFGTISAFNRNRKRTGNASSSGSGTGPEIETEATGRIGFRNAFEQQNRFPKPLVQTLENGIVSRKDPLRNERLYEWTDTGIEQGGGRRPRQKGDPRIQNRNGTERVTGNHRASKSSRGVFAGSKTDSLDKSRVLPQGADVHRRNGFSDRSSTAESKTAAGNESQLTTSGDVNVFLNGSGSRHRQRTADQTSRSSSSRGPSGSRPLSVNQAGVLPQSGSLQRTRGKRTQSSKTTLRRRRWGQSGPGAGIGFERKVIIRVDAKRLIVGRDYRIDLDSQNRNNPELLEQVLDGIEREARLWGMPPASFYWVPRIHFQIGPGGNNTASELKVSLKQAGLFLQLEYLQNSSKSLQRPE